MTGDDSSLLRRMYSVANRVQSPAECQGMFKEIDDVSYHRQPRISGHRLLQAQSSCLLHISSVVSAMSNHLPELWSPQTTIWGMSM